MHQPAQGRSDVSRFFSCPVRFSAEFDGFTMCAADLDQQIPLAQGTLARYASLVSSEALAGREVLSVHRTRQRMLALMMDGRCNNQEVARSFGVDRRTLHRRLLAEETSFMRLYDEIRLDLAQRYLRAGNIGAADIAGLLGMDSLSSFSRWFKGQTGSAPRRWRELERR
jgi:AraC-like DNA-binding protein